MSCTDTILSAYAQATIRCHSRRLIGRFGFTASDRDDIEQDLTVALLVELPKHDPQRSSINTWIAQVVLHAATTLVRRQRASNRDYRCRAPASASENRDADETTTRMRQDELRWDVGEILASLTDEEREVCEGLMHETPTNLARRLGMGRDQIYVIRDRLRRRFIGAGLQPWG